MRSTPRTSRRSKGRNLRAVAAGTAVVLGSGLLAGCSSDSDNGTAENGKDNITLTIGVFGEFGFEEAGLYDEYMDLNPHVTIEQTTTAQRDDYYAQLLTRLPTGSGLMDIQAIEVDNIYEQTDELSDYWVDYTEYDDVDLGHFAEWKTAQATNADGKVIGLGTDIGPTGMCYRTDLFEEAGLPTDPEEVAALWEGSWEDYLAVGEQFAADSPSGVAFTDSSEGVFNAVLNSFAEQMYDSSGEVIYKESEAVDTAWETGVQVAESGLSAQLEQFTQGWDQAIANGDFASLVCPAWMLGNLQANGGDAGEGTWQVTSAPAPSNWGGSFVNVPEVSENKDEAVKLAAWLTAPEQQATLFTERGSFPSSEGAQVMPEVADATHPYFQDAPIGEIFTEAARGIPTILVGPRDQTIREGLNDGLVMIEQQGASAADAWDASIRSIDNALDQ